MDAATSTSAAYQLGHSDEELRRLDTQGANLRPATERLLAAAGIGSGMRVLDVGCGSGDVTALVAQLVGPNGAVVALDRAGAALETTLRRARGLGYEHVSVVEADLTTATFDAPFDAIVGRQVLVHQPDPSSAVRSLAASLRPGGVVAFVELIMPPVALAWPPRPLYTQCCAWLDEGLRRGGMHADMGLRLYTTFVEAGFPEPSITVDGIVGLGSATSHLSWVAGTMRTFQPVFARAGMPEAAEAAADETLLARLAAETEAVGGTICGAMMGCGWARKAA